MVLLYFVFGLLDVERQDALMIRAMIEALRQAAGNTLAPEFTKAGGYCRTEEWRREETREAKTGSRFSISSPQESGRFHSFSAC